jgi:hypothetical protein
MEDQMGRPCSTNGDNINAYRILTGKPEGTRLLGRPRCRWMDNIKMDVWKIRWSGVDWVDLAQGRGQGRAPVSTVMNLRFP